jgi:hypothetical protein
MAGVMPESQAPFMEHDTGQLVELEWDTCVLTSIEDQGIAELLFEALQ